MSGQRGYIVTNPLGDSLPVDGSTIRSALFAPQTNHDELVAAMSATIADRDDCVPYAEPTS